MKETLGRIVHAGSEFSSNPELLVLEKAAMAFIYVAIILDVLALGIIILVFPRLVVGFSANTAQGAEICGLFITVWEARE